MTIIRINSQVKPMKVPDNQPVKRNPVYLGHRLMADSDFFEIHNIRVDFHDHFAVGAMWLVASVGNDFIVGCPLERLRQELGNTVDDILPVSCYIIKLRARPVLLLKDISNICVFPNLLLNFWLDVFPQDLTKAKRPVSASH